MEFYPTNHMNSQDFIRVKPPPQKAMAVKGGSQTNVCMIGTKVLGIKPYRIYHLRWLVAGTPKI